MFHKHDSLKLSLNQLQRHHPPLTLHTFAVTTLSVKPVCPVDMNVQEEDWQSRGTMQTLKEMLFSAHVCHVSVFNTFRKVGGKGHDLLDQFTFIYLKVNVQISVNNTCPNKINIKSHFTVVTKSKSKIFTGTAVEFCCWCKTKTDHFYLQVFFMAIEPTFKK